MSALRTSDLLKVSLRLAVLQSAWNTETLQSAGLAYCLVPGLERIHRNPEALGAAVQRYREPFNTHPFLAGVIAGAVLRLESAGRSPREIAAFTRGTMGALAAAGDPFFKGGLAPAVAVVASLIALLAGSLAGAIWLLVAFNLVHLTVRIGGVVVGFRRDDSGIERVIRWIGPARTRALRAMAAVLGGAVCGAAALRFGAPVTLPVLIVAGVAGIGCGTALTLARSAWAYCALGLVAGLLLLGVLT